MCPVDAETVGHFLLGCSISRVLRALIFSQLVFASWDSTSKDGRYRAPPQKKKKKRRKKTRGGTSVIYSPLFEVV
jgi:hypothetical protein